MEKAMIFAAGLGTRLRPLTDTMPKALVPVSGRPILGYQLERLAAAGVKEVVVNVHHFAEQVIRYLEEHDFGLRVRVSDERDELLDTGGGLARARQWLDGDAPVLVHNVDILSNVDLHRWAGAHPDGTTLLVSERQTQRYLLFDEENRLVGWTNVATGQVRSPYSKLDVARCSRYAFSGIQLFSPRLFSLMEGWPRRFSIIDFYLSVCREVPVYGCPEPGLRLLDIGKPAALAAAEDFLASAGNCSGAGKLPPVASSVSE